MEAEQYTEIDNFLMPIWKFNNFTAKEIFKEQSQEYTQKYIIQIINNKINESELSEMSTMLKQSPVFKDRASEELVGSLKKNIKEMHNVFLGYEKRACQWMKEDN